MKLFRIKNFTTNQDVVSVLDAQGPFQILEYQRDLSVNPVTAQMAYFSAMMNIRRRQVMCSVGASGITTQAGAMQWTAGNVQLKSGVKGVGDFTGKIFRGAATGETAIKPEYTGSGLLVLEPTFNHLLLLNVAEWGGAVLDDGIFMACESTIQQSVVARRNVSSAFAGGEGLFNLCLTGAGIAVLEIPCAKEELIEIELNDDEMRIDGNMAMVWSNTLQFTVEKSSKSLLGSAASGEGLVNVYRGTGRILMSPVARNNVVAHTL